MWHEQYVGKPWAAIPDPPRSFSCGELVRHILRLRLGADVPEVLANAAVFRECLRDLADPARYGFYPLLPDQHPQEYDAAYMIRGTREDHVGIAVDTADGLMILHCQQKDGVVLESPAELLGTGVRRINWRRHVTLGGMPCPM